MQSLTSIGKSNTCDPGSTKWVHSIVYDVFALHHVDDIELDYVITIIHSWQNRYTKKHM